MRGEGGDGCVVESKKILKIDPGREGAH